MRISVFGIGYVGAVTSACLADSGHEVIAVDTSAIKVACINEGRSPIVEKGLDELLKKAVSQGLLSATEDHEYAVRNSEISLICVGTPSRKDGSLNLDYIKTVCAQIGTILRGKNDFHTVVNRSTVLPGTLMNVIRPILEKTSGKIAGEDFGLGNNPEFLREGTAVQDYREPTQIVVGATDEHTAEIILRMYEGIESPRSVTDPGTSEGVKYVSNAWRAAKVSFANEIGNMLKRHDVDSHRVMKIFFMDNRINMGPSFLVPGFAFGGSCLPKDVRAIRASANDKGLATPLFDAILEANSTQVAHAFEMIENTGMKNVGLLGLSFKPGTDDLRESPLVTLASMLLDSGYNLRIYDPCVWKSRNMNGPNREYMDQRIPQISACLTGTPHELLENSDIFVIGNGTKEFSKIIEQTKRDAPIVDLVRLNGSYEDRESYAGICW